MNDEKRFPPPISDHAARPLDVARSAFAWLVTGPDPVSVNGRDFDGLPDSAVPLDELRDRLMHRRCPQDVRDAVWAHLVERSRDGSRAGLAAVGATWTVAAVGVALPALTGVAARLSTRFAGDPSDIHASVLAGFVAELPVVELDRPRILLRLRWASYRAGMACVRDALDSPAPVGALAGEFSSAAPPTPAGHPDFVLARAVGEGAITAAEAELIAVTRLEQMPLIEAAADRGMSYEAAKRGRLRAEARLVAFLREEAADTGSGLFTDATSAPDIADLAVANLAITTAGSAVADRSPRADFSPSVSGAGERSARGSGRPVSLPGRNSGVPGRGKSRPGSDSGSAESTTEVPRCA